MDHEEYKHNVFKVLTKNVPSEVLNVKQGQFLKVLNDIAKDPSLMTIGDFFDQQSKEDITYESDNI